MGENTPEVSEDPHKAFAYLVSRCASGLLNELVAQGETEVRARNCVIHHFLAFAAGEACRQARREGREPDPTKWAAATEKAFDAAVGRTSATEWQEATHTTET